jgi:peptidoglycan pentaglycine glycine transferase (the first glycine)
MDFIHQLSDSEWDDFLAQHPEAHLLQTSGWGSLKRAFGWQAVHLAVDNPSGDRIGAQVLFRHLPFGRTLAYLPKGPVGGSSSDRLKDWRNLWRAIDAVCRERKAIFLKVEPDIWEGTGIGVLDVIPEAYNFPAYMDPGKTVPTGFQLTKQTIQPPRTILVDLKGEETDLLARMKQKTRYNIRLAIKKGVIVQPSNDLDIFHRLAKITAQRDGFGVHSRNYYQQVYKIFHPRGQCELLLAVYKDTPLAALLVFAHRRRAWYFYGASSDEYRQLMPNYLVQWEAMRWARECGCIQYDLWGVPDAEEDVLEVNFNRRSDGLWGVYRFKRGFGGQVRRACGPWERVYNPSAYAMYRLWTEWRKDDGG